LAFDGAWELRRDVELAFNLTVVRALDLTRLLTAALAFEGRAAAVFARAAGFRRAGFAVFGRLTGRRFDARATTFRAIPVFFAPRAVFRLARFGITGSFQNLDSFAISVVLSAAYRNSADVDVLAQIAPGPATFAPRLTELAGRRSPPSNPAIDRHRRTRKAWPT